MEYRRLGNTGLMVSAISYGNYLNANDEKTIENNKKIIKRAWELGINFFDTAEGYGAGQAEIQLGEALKEIKDVHRQDFVISTKIFFGAQSFYEPGPPNTKFLSRKHIIEGLRASLKRLQLTYVDVVFAHRYDLYTPIEEVCRAFDWTIRHGLAHYWGTSEWSAQQITEAIGVCERLNLHKPVAEQPQYNLLYRERFEWEYEVSLTMDTVAQFGLHYSKDYSQENIIIIQMLMEDLRHSKMISSLKHSLREHSLSQKVIFFQKQDIQKLQAKLQAFGQIAKDLGITQAQLAMAWVLKNKDVSTAITGATRIQQIEETVAAIQFQKLITPEVEAKIEEIFKSKPTTALNWKSQKPYPTRRDLYV